MEGTNQNLHHDKVVMNCSGFFNFHFTKLTYIMLLFLVFYPPVIWIVVEVIVIFLLTLKVIVHATAARTVACNQLEAKMLDANLNAFAERPVAQLISMTQELLAMIQLVKIAPQRTRHAQKILIASSMTAKPMESVSTLGCVPQRRKICAILLMLLFLGVLTKEPNAVPPPAAVSGLELES